MKTIQSTKHSCVTQETVVGEAERWFTRLRAHDTSDAERAQYQKWLEHSDENRRAAASCERVWSLADALANDAEMQAYASPAPGKSQPEALRVPRTLRRFVAPFALAASVLIATVLVRPDFLGIGPDRYDTQVGEQQRVVLDDGSVMHLNTDTRVEVKYSEQSRLVKIVSGEATFSVEHDESRPFVVQAGNGFVRAVGTRFNVYSTPERVTVAVLEGAVVVGRDGCAAQSPGSATATLTCGRHQPDTPAPSHDIARLPIVRAGEEVSYSMEPIAPLPVSAPVTELRRVEAWQKGKLEFDAVPLGSAITEINRYLTRKMVLADPALADVRVTGVFRVGETESVIFALHEMLGVSASVRQGEIWLNAPVPETRSISL